MLMLLYRFLPVKLFVIKMTALKKISCEIKIDDKKKRINMHFSKGFDIPASYY